MMPTDPKSVTELAAKAANELTPTSVEDWGRTRVYDDGFTTELPSGNVVKMRRTLDLPLMLQTGKIPNPLAGIIAEMLKQGTSDFPAEAMQDMDALRQMMEMLDQGVVNSVIEPPFSKPEPRGEDETEEEYTARLSEWKPDEGTVSIYAMEMPDKMYVFAVTQGAAADLGRFREEQAAGMGIAPVGSGVPSPTKRTGGTANRQQRRAAAKKK